MANPLLLPPRLLLRALDDLNALADDHIQEVHAAVEPLHGELAGVRQRLSELLDELTGVQGVVEPLQNAAERMGRITDRLPGGGS